MQKIKLYKDELLSIVKANREKHVTTYKKSYELYRKEVAKKVKQLLKDVEGNKEFSTHINLTKPVNMEKHYDTVIRMLELTVDTEIELTTGEFQQYVEDQWVWKHEFDNVSNSYLAAAKRR